MSADVIQFPIVRNETPQRTEPMSVVTCALCRMNLLMAAYLQPGDRPEAELILMKINEILEEPALCEVAGIEKLRIINHHDEGA